MVAVVGDGASLYGIQALWSAAHLRRGVLYVILSNGGYVIMDRLAERYGKPAPWPGFGDRRRRAGAGVSAARRGASTTLRGARAALDDAVPRSPGAEEPLLLDVVIEPTTTSRRSPFPDEPFATVCPDRVDAGGRRGGRPPCFRSAGGLRDPEGLLERRLARIELYVYVPFLSVTAQVDTAGAGTAVACSRPGPQAEVLVSRAVGDDERVLARLQRRHGLPSSRSRMKSSPTDGPLQRHAARDRARDELRHVRQRA